LAKLPVAGAIRMAVLEPFAGDPGGTVDSFLGEVTAAAAAAAFAAMADGVNLATAGPAASAGSAGAEGAVAALTRGTSGGGASADAPADDLVRLGALTLEGSACAGGDWAGDGACREGPTAGIAVAFLTAAGAAADLAGGAVEVDEADGVGADASADACPSAGTVAALARGAASGGASADASVEINLERPGALALVGAACAGTGDWTGDGPDREGAGAGVAATAILASGAAEADLAGGAFEVEEADGVGADAGAC